jgi:hypothetical protein
VRKAFLVLSILIVLLVPFLSACESGEMQQVVYWAKLWAMVHDITDADGNPNYGAIARFAVGEAFGLGSTGDEESDAAIDCARTLNKIRQAEEASNEAFDNLYQGQNIRKDVLPDFNRAIKLRPEDWSYYNGRGIANLEDLENAKADQAAAADFQKAVGLAKESGQPEEYLRMLRDREQALARLVAAKNERQSYPTKEIYQEQARLYDELYKLTGENSYRLLKQQADSNLARGYYLTGETEQ